MAALATNLDHNFSWLLCISVLLHLLEYLFLTSAAAIISESNGEELRPREGNIEFKKDTVGPISKLPTDAIKSMQNNASVKLYSNYSMGTDYHWPVNETFNFKAYRVSNDGKVGAFVLLLLFGCVLGSVYFSRMWKHKDHFYSDGDDTTLFATSSPKAINRDTKNITEILKSRLNYLTVIGKKKVQKFLSWNKRKRKGIDRYVDDEEDVIYSRALLENQEY